MKLSDVLNETQAHIDLKSAFAIIKKYQQDPWGVTDTDLGAAVDLIIHNHKKYTYTGTLYRVIKIDVDNFMKTPDMRLILSKLHEYDQQKQNKRHFSWAKTKNKVVEFFTDDDDKFHGSVGLFFKQTNTGVDVTKVVGKDDDFDEKEVICTIENNMHLIGSMAYDKRKGDFKWFNPTDFKSLLSTLKANQTQVKSK